MESLQIRLLLRILLEILLLRRQEQNGMLVLAIVRAEIPRNGLIHAVRLAGARRQIQQVESRFFLEHLIQLSRDCFGYIHFKYPLHKSRYNPFLY